ncbi:MAG TPA: response regulator [Flavisolibacter sp.]|jgi:DNA-binding response OmpR family regulator|nr:response regulator [Flavisolibacter sp.]
MKAEVSKRILVVDDDIDLLMLLERQLKQQGYEAETAISLAEAEELVVYFDPHLVLLDINIRGEDGRQLCWKLKNQPVYRIPKVLIISGFDYNASRAALFGADDILPKPFNTEFLFNRISQLTADAIIKD